MLVNSLQIFDKTGLCSHFLAGRRFFPVKQLLTVQRLHLIGPHLQVHVDDVNVRGRALSRNARAAEIKIGRILGSSCRLNKQLLLFVGNDTN